MTRTGDLRTAMARRAGRSFVASVDAFLIVMIGNIVIALIETAEPRRARAGRCVALAVLMFFMSRATVLSEEANVDSRNYTKTSRFSCNPMYCLRNRLLFTAVAARRFFGHTHA